MKDNHGIDIDAMEKGIHEIYDSIETVIERVHKLSMLIAEMKESDYN